MVDLFLKNGPDYTFKIIDVMIDKYCNSVFQYAGRINLCQQMLFLSRGTELVLAAGPELSIEDNTIHVFSSTPTARMHEALRQHEGSKDKVCVGSVAVLQTFYLDMVRCPQEMVRFSHKRNSCKCLKTVYNDMKKTAQRTAVCHECEKQTVVNDIMVCSSCNVVQYCRSACQIAAWPIHKGFCKHFKENKLLYKEIKFPASLLNPKS